MFVVTCALSTTGGYPLEGYAPELDMPKGAQLADGPVEFRKATLEQLANGADWIKVYNQADLSGAYADILYRGLKS